MRIGPKLSAVRRRIAAVAAIAALGVAVGGVANAAPVAPHNLTNYQIVESSEYSVDPNTAAETTVSCPSGMVPTSGGEWNDSSGAVHLVASSPYQNRWGTTVYNTGSSWAAYTTFAVCVSGLASYQVVWANPMTISGNGVATESDAYCPSGMSILGGGFSSGGPYNIQLYASASDTPAWGQQQAWRTILANRNGKDVLAESIVVCGTGLNIQRVEGEEWVSGQYLSYGETCPTGMSVISGGVFSVTETGDGFAYQGVIGESWPASSYTWYGADYPTYEANEPSIAFDISDICAS